jgi:predicted phosphodiesterase
MRYAIFSDIHDSAAGFERVLGDAERQAVDELICLGDVGRDSSLYYELRDRRIPCTFGNWEVSGLRRMSPLLAGWVGAWPACLRRGNAIFCHATPNLPAEAQTTSQAVAVIAKGVGWLELFPRLHQNEGARWQALAALEQQAARVAFHGHTHIQEAWAWEGNLEGVHQLRCLNAPDRLTLRLGSGASPNRYLVGVGSAGQPLDGVLLRYAIYDDISQQVWLRRV